MPPGKRKRDILDGFDPNKSDSEDENFEPSADRPRRTKKKQRSSGGRNTSRRHHGKYAGSDIDDDDDEVSESEDEGSFIEDDDEDEDEDLPTNAAGRRTRKAAVKHSSYRESSDESVVEDSAAEELEDLPSKPAPPVRRSRIVTIKTKGKISNTKEPPTPSVTTRRTRAHTEEADVFVELSTSGKHALPARASRSRSPEAAAMAQSARATRGSKGLKKPPAPIEEATQESSARGGDTQADPDVTGDVNPAEEENNDRDELDDQAAQVAGEGDEEEADVGAAGAAAVEVEDSANGDADDGDAMEVEKEGEAEDDDDDDGPITRRTRASRTSISGPPAEEADDESDNNAGTRRLTRKSRLRSKKKKSAQEPSSDFEPGEDDSAEEGGFASDSSQKADASNGDEEASSQNSRGRPGRRTSKRRQNRDSDGEDDVDRDEVAMEAEELRASSHSRPRRRRSPSILYQPPDNKRRRTAPVDYSIKPLDQFFIEQEEEEPEQAATPARRKNGRTGGGWQRNLLSTFGPFGGGGGVGSLLGGPWGTGATGGVESDSSDDERPPHRTGTIGGNVGMTPTSAAVPGFAAPLNLEAITGVSATPNVGKVKNQKAFADADPLGVDMTVDFSKVGGLEGHINQLKEMVTLPLLYPELFQRFKVTPPRGVLFHGPPGTGKTLLARALANSVGIGGRKITFYMRKGADALSKWVGEAEKQLRLLFEEARRTQPSIIFFDEIDGLAPVRSSKQEQIHASIVSTLLALMDGMDGRGQVIVIGATNRPDNIDPALRRPGRFDREFYFPLPDLEGRRAIIDIHTKEWGLSDEFKGTLAENSKGYGGADLRALCTEAALNAIQRTYPQIYSSKEKLIVDPERIDIHATDFLISMKRMIPSSERSAASAAAPLPKAVEPLLRTQLASILKAVNDILPRKKKVTALEEAMYEPHDDADQGFGRENLNQEFERTRIFRPRLLITGIPGMGHGYLASAIQHHLEGVHIQSFDLPSLLGDGRPLEQVIVSLFVEVKRHKPAVISIPNIETWQAMLPDSAYVTFTAMLKSIPPTDPVLVLGTAECTADDLPHHIVKDFFGFSRKNRVVIERPNKESRIEYFSKVISHVRKSPSEFPDPTNRKKRVLEVLPVAPPPPSKPKTKAEIKEEMRKDHLLLNLLKVQLQPIMDQIKKYKKFRLPVIADSQIAYLWQEADPNYVRPDVAGSEVRPFEIAKDKDGIEGLRATDSGKFFYNLDLATIEERLSNGYYARPRDFYNDVCSLAKDARNIGDKERVLKANELVTNVEVDVAEAEARLIQADWEGLHQRQAQRARDAAEKARKRKAAQSIVNLIQSDVQDSDSGVVGPVRIGEAIPGTTTARFRLMSPRPLSNGHSGENSHLSNGNSVPSRLNDEDVQMGGVGDEDITQPFSQMGPPSQRHRVTADFRSQDVSGRATAGTTQMQISQVSVLTGVPPGMSPSAILNEASTTKTSDPSTNRSSGHWSTQATNGIVHGTEGGGEASQLPDTQPMGGESGPSEGGTATSSDGPWIHSQADALKRGMMIMQPRTSEESSPTSSQMPPAASSKSFRSSAAASVANLLNDDVHQYHMRNSGSSGSSSSQPQPIIPPDSHIKGFLQELTDRTSGCTVEQLEQINRELMDEVWSTRDETNRSRVLAALSKAFNEIIEDIEEIQGELPSSQADRNEDGGGVVSLR